MDAPMKLMLVVGWTGMLAGGLSGAALGLFFHREEWMGGYGRFRRRLARLGHISFFGLGFLNLRFAFTWGVAGLGGAVAVTAAGAFDLTQAPMPRSRRSGRSGRRPSSSPTSPSGATDFVQETGLYEVQITVMTPFPGTPLYQRLLADGRILHPRMQSLFDAR